MRSAQREIYYLEGILGSRLLIEQSHGWASHYVYGFVLFFSREVFVYALKNPHKTSILI